MSADLQTEHRLCGADLLQVGPRSLSTAAADVLGGTALRWDAVLHVVRQPFDLLLQLHEHARMYLPGWAGNLQRLCLFLQLSHELQYVRGPAGLRVGQHCFGILQREYL